MSKICVALLVSDDDTELVKANYQKECTAEELKNLKEKDDKGDITLIGWLPYDQYNGGEISQFHTKFRHW